MARLENKVCDLEMLNEHLSSQLDFVQKESLKKNAKLVEMQAALVGKRPDVRKKTK